MGCELQYINWTILFRKSNTAAHRNHVNRERNKGAGDIHLSGRTHTYDWWPCRGLRGCLREATKKMSTVHLSLSPPHYFYALAQNHSKEHGSTQRIHGMWSCTGGRQENESERKWRPIPPGYGNRSACPPAAGRNRPLFWPRRPSRGPKNTHICVKETAEKN